MCKKATSKEKKKSRNKKKEEVEQEDDLVSIAPLNLLGMLLDFEPTDEDYSQEIENSSEEPSEETKESDLPFSDSLATSNSLEESKNPEKMTKKSSTTARKHRKNK